jgi:hypothetical protein
MSSQDTKHVHTLPIHSVMSYSSVDPDDMNFEQIKLRAWYNELFYITLIPTARDILICL